MSNQSENPKVLFFGFSVTGQANSYAHILANRWKTAGFAECKPVGLGAFQPQDAAYYIEHILETTAPTHVVFEVSTSAWRGTARRAISFEWPLRYLIEAAIRQGAIPILLCLPRAQVNYENDLATEVTRRVAAHYSAPILQVDLEMYRSGQILEMHPDGIHPTYEASIWTADRIENELQNIILQYGLAASSTFFEQGTMGILRLADYYKFLTFETDRGGFSATCPIVTQNDLAMFKLGTKQAIFGLMYVCGPAGAEVSIMCEGGEIRTFTAYDRHSYYNRMAVSFFPPLRTRQLCISVSPKIPEISLIKGTNSTVERAVPLFALCVRDERKFHAAFTKISEAQ